jgi:hypothetical protein
MAFERSALTERREFARVQTSKLAVVEEPDAPPIPARVVDICERSVRLKMPKPPAQAVHYLMRFKFGSDSYVTYFTPVRSATADAGQYHWGCMFTDLSPQEATNLRRAIFEQFAHPHVRPWLNIRRECLDQPNGKVLVGYTRTGDDVILSSSDCLHIGAKGVQQFVLNLEQATRGVEPAGLEYVPPTVDSDASDASLAEISS